MAKKSVSTDITRVNVNYFIKTSPQLLVTQIVVIFFQQGSLKFNSLAIDVLTLD
jgi:hypothetical protein